MSDFTDQVRDPSTVAPAPVHHSLRERILATSDLATQLVEMPEWGEGIAVELRTMTANERTGFIVRLGQGEGGIEGIEQKVLSSIYAEVVVCCAFDPDTGEKIFTPDDIPTLGERSGALLERLALPALRLSGLAPDPTTEHAHEDDDATDSLGKDGSSPTTATVGSPGAAS